METGRVWTSSSPVIYPSVYSHTDGRIETGRLQYEAIQCLVAAVAPLSVANAPVGKWSADRLPYLVLHAFSDSNRGRRQNRAEVLRLLLRSRVNPSLDKPPRSNFMGHDAVRCRFQLESWILLLKRGTKGERGAKKRWYGLDHFRYREGF